MKTFDSTFQLLYVPGHKDIPGNELADVSAKAATSSPGDYANEGLSMNSIKAMIKREVKDAATTHPTVSQTYAEYSEKKDRIAVKSRKEGALLAQLRSGHHKRLAYYCNIIDETISDRCQRCDSDAIDTVEHWLT